MSEPIREEDLSAGFKDDPNSFRVSSMRCPCCNGCAYWHPGNDKEHKCEKYGIIPKQYYDFESYDCPEIKWDKTKPAYDIARMSRYGFVKLDENRLPVIIQELVDRED